MHVENNIRFKYYDKIENISNSYSIKCFVVIRNKIKNIVFNKNDFFIYKNE